jgi:membrane protein
MTTERSSTQQRIEAARDRVTTTRDRAQRTMLWQVWERMLEIEFVDRSVALAGKAFVSFFPLVIVVAAFVPAHTRQSIFTTLTHRLGMHGAALTSAKQAFASASDVRRATGILGLLLTFFFASSFTSAVQRVYLRAWRRAPAGKVSGYTRGPIWLAVLLGYMALLGAVRGLLGNGVGLGGFVLLSLLLSSALWWFTAWFLLLGDVRWRVLLPSGLITGIALGGYAVSANIWMPNVVSSNQSQFGFFGVALALVTWFSGASVCVIVGACAGPVFAEDQGFMGKLVRGSEPDLLVPGAAPPLPAPTRPLSIRDAFRSDQAESEEAPPAAGGQS